MAPRTKANIATVDQQQSQAIAAPVTPQTEAGAIMQMIITAAKDPTIDVDRIKELWAMKREMEADVSRSQFMQAMSAAQGEMKAVLVDRDNSQTHSKYASFAALDDAIRPIYSKHGFSVTFVPEDCPKEEHVRVVAEVSKGGHTKRYPLDMPCDGKGARGNDVMTKTHAVMSATRYCQRGLLILIFNIATTLVQPDDDGNAAGGHVEPERITEDQEMKLRDMLIFADKDEKAFCKAIKKGHLSDILAIDFEAARKIIQRQLDKKEQNK